MNFLHIILLAVVQGLAELLPVSSSAHVIIASKLLGLDPTTPQMTLLLVMLHTGTMFAVILYFWKAWRKTFFSSKEVFKQQAIRLAVATALTAVVGFPLIKGIEIIAEKTGHVGVDADGKPMKAEIEMLFGNLTLIASALAAAGTLILVAGLAKPKGEPEKEINITDSIWIGGVQGFCLPFRGFSRSGVTISTGMLRNCIKSRVEEFSFALAVILTPAVIGKEALRMIKAQHEAGHAITADMFGPSALGMVFAFLAGLVALKWLSGWLEHGRWWLFGVYCLVAAVVAAVLRFQGY